AAQELTRVTYPDNTQLNYLYDSLNRVRQVTNGRNHNIVPSYDNAYRLTSVAFPTSGETTLQFSYNTDDTLHSTTDSAGTTTYTRLPSGLVSSVSHNYAAIGLANVQRLDYTYYPDGRRHTLAWYDGANL